MTSDLECLHESWECSGNWHTCTDCQKALGTRDSIILSHDVDHCEVCRPVKVCSHDGEVWCDNCKPSQVWLDNLYERYTTKDSGQREEFDSGMVRDTQEGKPRWDLLIPQEVPYEDQLLTRFAQLLARGAEKYSARNWEQAEGKVELDRFKASAFRHFMQWYTEEMDEDHASACLFNILGAETTKWKMKHGGKT